MSPSNDVLIKKNIGRLEVKRRDDSLRAFLESESEARFVSEDDGPPKQWVIELPPSAYIPTKSRRAAIGPVRLMITSHADGEEEGFEAYIKIANDLLDHPDFVQEELVSRWAGMSTSGVTDLSEFALKVMRSITESETPDLSGRCEQPRMLDTKNKQISSTLGYDECGVSIDQPLDFADSNATVTETIDNASNSEDRGLKRGKVATRSFRVVSAPAPREAVPLSLDAFVKNRSFSRLQTRETTGESSTDILLLTEAAQKSILEFISWNRVTRNNRVEQGGLLVGTAYRDESRDLIFGVVENALLGRSAGGSASYLTMYHTTWKEMLEDFEIEVSRGAYSSEAHVIGWFHTHPNRLDVFMSGTDMNTQRSMFYRPWNFSLVINPHRRLVGAYVGPTAIPCHLALLIE